MDLTNLVKEMTDAVQSGNVQYAEKVVAQLANLNARLNISTAKQQNDQSTTEKQNNFNVTVEVEDREVAGVSFALTISPNDTIMDLKRKVQLMFGFPEQVQRWIINQRLPEDKATLKKCHVDGPMTLYLYLLPVHAVNDPNVENGMMASRASGGDLENPNNGIYNSGSNTVAKVVSGDASITEVKYSVNLDVTAAPGQAPRGATSSSSYDLDTDKEESLVGIGNWSCDDCTYNNPGMRQLCQMCSRDRFPVMSTQSNDMYTIPPRVQTFPGFQEETMRDLQIGNRVIGPTDRGQKKGTVRWVGVLPDMEGGDLYVGVEFDEPVGSGNGDFKGRFLFKACPGHASILSISSLSIDGTSGAS